MNAPYWLSLDFDFFVREEGVWDWQHAESYLYRELLWGYRAAGLMLRGEDPEQATRRFADDPQAFVDTLLARGLTLKGAQLYVSDSHAVAIRAFNPHRIFPKRTWLHFDAHHDLGYHAEVVDDDEARGVVHCDDWMVLALRRQRYAHAKVIYPGWKGNEEWQSLADATWLGAAERRVSHAVWPAAVFDPGKVERIHLCRSGSWTPPWHDGDFIALVRRLERETGNKAHMPALNEERVDVLTPREWDRAAASAEADTLRKMWQANHPTKGDDNAGSVES